MRDGTEIILRGFDSYEVKLGDDLRGERASRGKSLLDVQRELKIKAAYIDAIENCDATVFPNRGYVAGYVRAYARYLGRDADEIYERFCAESGFQGVNATLTDPRGRLRAARAAPAATTRRDQDEMLGAARFLRNSGPTVSMAAVSGLGSVLLLCGLIAVLGYGAWYVLRDIQRIAFEPVAQAPVVVDLAQAQSAPVPDTAQPSPSPAPTPNGVALHELYAPSLQAPSLERRDGPIASIDPDRYGAFAPRDNATTRDTPAAPGARMRSAPDGVPLSTASDGPALPSSSKTVTVVARDDAWVRVFLADDTVIFERILKPGESYEVPEALDAPMLRAGNAGAVYLRVGDTVFGPLGTGASIARRVALTANDISASWPKAEDTAFTARIISQSARLPEAAEDTQSATE